MGTAKGAVSPIMRYIRDLEDGPYYTLRQAAGLMGLPDHALRRLVTSDPDHFRPDWNFTIGSVTTYVYTPARIDSAIKIIRANPERFNGKRGRSKIWSAEEKVVRDRRTCRASYLRRRSAERAAAGDTDGAIESMGAASEITRELRAQRDEREREILMRST